MRDLIVPTDAPPVDPPTRKKRDPAALGYPASLAVEIALQEHTPKQLCKLYGIDEKTWDRIRADPLFQNDVSARMIELQSEGVSFKMKARLQAEGMLDENWRLVHHVDTPANVKADLIKHTVRMAGLDASKDQAAAAQGAAIGAALQINLHLG